MTEQTQTFSLGGRLTVHRLGFGALRLATNSFDGPPRDPATGVAVLRRAVELGVDHIDTAGFYRRGPAVANEMIRTALAPYPDGLSIATKVGPLRGPDGGLAGEGPAGPGELRGQVEEDLRSLGVDRLDLVYLRIGGMSVPAGEPIGDRFAALAELQREGLIGHLGISNVDAAHLAQARAIAPVAAVQNRWTGDREVLAECEAAGIAYVPFGTLGSGLRPVTGEEVDKVAARLGATAAQVRIAASLAMSPCVLAIPGTGSVAHLEENLGARDLVLEAGDLAELGL